MAFADSEGTRIYYDERGEGEPVLLCLTGWCVHHTIFLPLAERLGVPNIVCWSWTGGDMANPRHATRTLAMPRCSRMSSP